MRKSPIAGSWYPGDKKQLEALITDLLDNVQLPELSGRPFGIISPHAGIQFSGRAAACGFKTLAGKKISRVILIGPSHYTYMSGIATSGVGAYETPLGPVSVDRGISDALQKHSLFRGPRKAELPEHSLEMQLPFLQVVLGDFTLVPLVAGELSPEDYDTAAARLTEYLDEETIVVASSDFTHYGRRFGYLPFRDTVKENLQKLDGGAIENIIKKDSGGFLKYIEETGATICGCRPIGVLLKMLPPAAEGRLLTYYTSGDLTGDFNDTVSYASIAFHV